jgi:mono/diheme cytochrome c family protein
VKRRAGLLAPLVLAVAAGCGAETSGTPAAELWREHCASCHGADGRGHPARRRLEPRLDLARSALVAGRERGLIYQRIAYGYANMPGFAHKMPRGDLELMVGFVERFAAR